jgi:hypothetical protein
MKFYLLLNINIFDFLKKKDSEKETEGPADLRMQRSAKK